MCDSEPTCQKPENLKVKPGECSPEQIKICHGEIEDHLCENPEDDK